MSNKKGLDPEESAAEDLAVDFSATMKGITPLKTVNRVVQKKAMPSSTPKFSTSLADKTPPERGSSNKDSILADYQASTPLKSSQTQRTARTTVVSSASKLTHPSAVQSEFAAFVGSATPVNTKNKRVLERPKPTPTPRSNTTLNEEPLGIFPSDYAPWTDDGQQELEFLRPSLERDVLRKLRQGEWPAQAALDFHGCSLDHARERFVAFMQRVTQSHLRCVRLVHGKGLGSKDGTPIIKPALRAWLIQQEEVLAFCPATAQNGGEGAVMVLLKAKKLP